jgi:hypothetical protein
LYLQSFTLAIADERDGRQLYYFTKRFMNQIDGYALAKELLPGVLRIKKRPDNLVRSSQA